LISNHQDVVIEGALQGLGIPLRAIVDEEVVRDVSVSGRSLTIRQLYMIGATLTCAAGLH